MNINKSEIVLPLQDRLKIVTEQIATELEQKQHQEGIKEIYGFKIGLAREIGNLKIDNEEVLKNGLKQALENCLVMQVKSFDGIMPDAKPLAATFLITDIARKMGIELDKST